MSEKILNIKSVDPKHHPVSKWRVQKGKQTGYIIFDTSLLKIKEQEGYVVSLEFIDPNGKTQLDQQLIALNVINNKDNECDKGNFALTVSQEIKFDFVEGYYKVKAKLLKDNKILDKTETEFYVAVID